MAEQAGLLLLANILFRFFRLPRALTEAKTPVLAVLSLAVPTSHLPSLILNNVEPYSDMSQQSASPPAFLSSFLLLPFVLT